MSSDPYASPLSRPPEDHSSPAFKAIPVTSWKAIILLSILPLGLGIELLRLWLTSSGEFGSFPTLFFTQVGWPLAMTAGNVRLARKLRTHPLVTSGQALCGGAASLGAGRGAVAGHLFITRSALVFFQLSGGWDAGTLTTIPFSEIESATLRPRAVFPRIYLDLALRSGPVTTFTLLRAKVWFRAIDQIRHEIPAAPSASLPQP